MKQNKQEQIKDEWLDKLDAEIMWWFYDQIDLLFNATVVIDSTEIRNILKKAKKQIISQTRQEAVEDIKKLMIEDLLKHNSKTIGWCGGCEDTGYNWAIQDVIELLSQEKK